MPDPAKDTLEYAGTWKVQILNSDEQVILHFELVVLHDEVKERGRRLSGLEASRPAIFKMPAEGASWHNMNSPDVERFFWRHGNWWEDTNLTTDLEQYWVF